MAGFHQKVFWEFQDEFAGLYSLQNTILGGPVIPRCHRCRTCTATNTTIASAVTTTTNIITDSTTTTTITSATTSLSTTTTHLQPPPKPPQNNNTNNINNNYSHIHVHWHIGDIGVLHCAKISTRTSPSQS